MAALVLFLSVKPAVTLLVENGIPTEESCCAIPCADEQEEQEQEEDSMDDCCGDTCNPFRACCTQLVYNGLNPLIQPLPVMLALDQQFTGYSSSLLSSGYTDFWQPPRQA